MCSSDSSPVSLTVVGVWPVEVVAAPASERGSKFASERGSKFASLGATVSRGSAVWGFGAGGRFASVGVFCLSAGVL